MWMGMDAAKAAVWRNYLISWAITLENGTGM
jgi:hypothetical protein